MKKGLLSTLIFLVFSVGNAFSQSMIISGGNDHGIALCSKGQIFAWGYNEGNRLCLKDPSGNDVEPSPKEVETGGLTFSMLSAGSGGHSVALSCNKLVYCWGDNRDGQCGRPKSEIITDGKPVPVYKGEVEDGYEEDGTKSPTGQYLGNVKYISGTTHSSMAIMDDGKGRVVIWGNYKGVSNHLPQYIVDENDKPLENVIHITGGDDNILLIVGDSPDAKVGTAYSVGNWNGRGARDLAQADSWIAKPVLKGTGRGDVSSGETIKNIRTSGLADGGGFVVEGGTGYVYAWGNSGWWGPCGLQMASEGTYAEKVTSGEYETITSEPYLTDVIQVIGGNGNGTAVTKEGYILYWGSNEAAGGTGSGGVIPNSDYASTVSDTKKIGPVFGNYCAGEHKGIATEHRVEDAVAIARGDLYGFMVNSEGKFYTWGSCARPVNSTTEMSGTLGIGEVEYVSTCFKEIKGITCRSKDVCPEAFMLPKVDKCPGKSIELYSGFTPLSGTEDNYYFKWSLDGVELKDPSDPDKYNKDAITVTDPGVYRVDILYIGVNVPCDNCPETFAKCEVIDMMMPIDADTLETCVLEPSASNEVAFSAEVTDNFYKVGDKASFAVFESETSNDTLLVTNMASGIKEKEIFTNGAGDVFSFKVPGNYVTTIDNKDKPSKDTLYEIWVEDVTQFNTILGEKDLASLPNYIYVGPNEGDAQAPVADNTKIPNLGTNSDQNYALRINLPNTSVLKSFSIFAIAQQAPQYSCTDWQIKDWHIAERDSNTAVLEITPIIYKGGKVNGSQYEFGKEYWRGEKQTFSMTLLDGVKECIVKCNKELEVDPSRGAEYILVAEIKTNGKVGSWLIEDFGSGGMIDSENLGIKSNGGTSGNSEQKNQNTISQFWNVTFGKKTEYNCGRIPLYTRYHCPCSSPDEVSITASKTIDDSRTKDARYNIIELCKESDELTLNISPLTSSNTDAKFDILWYKGNDIVSEELNVTENEIKTDWATVAGATDITEDVEKIYYVMVRDNEKPLSEACFVYDSIKVIAHPVPADTLVWDTFCLTSRLDEPRFVASPLSNKDIHWVGDDPTVASVWASIIAPTTFDYTITDKVTTCVGETHSYTVTVNKTPLPDVETLISIIKEPGTKLQLLTSIRSVAEDCEIHWYTTETGSEEIKEVNLDEKGTLTVWAEQYNTVTECSSERIEVTIVINETPAPTPRNEHLCLGQDEIQDLREYVTAKDENHKIKIYDSQTETELKGEDLKFNPTAKGVYKFLASQSTMENGDEIESGKVPFEITVHEVATLKLDLPDNPTSYCINDTDNPPTELKFESNNDGDISGAMWSESPDMSNSVSSITPTNNTSGTKTYYVRAEYDNDYADPNAGNASTVCLGKIQKIEITTNQTELPATKTDFKIQYLKEEGKADNQFKTLLSQTDTAVIVKDNKHKLVWYDKNHVELPSEPRPDYNENQQEDTEDYYYVRQYNTETGCYSEYQKVVVTISAFLKPTVKSIQLCQGDLDLVSDYILEAKINKGAKAESDFKLVWYTKDPNIYSDLTGESEIDLKKNADVMAFNANPDTPEKDFTFYVVQEYTGEGGGKSPREELTVSILSKPVLITKNPDPICKGTSVHLGNYYKISEQIPLRDYYTQLYGYSSVPYLGGDDQESGNLATKHGTYKARAFFMLNGKECTTRFEEINVTVQDLEVGIVGDDWTCPGRGVDLKAEIKKSEHMSTEDTPTYSWKVSPSGVTGFFETFNTSGNGLREGGESVSVSLEVSMGACKGKKAERNHVITVKDPGVSGKITFDEQNNTTNGSKTLPSVSNDNNLVSFDACNKKVDITFNVDQTEEEFTYENLNTGDKGVGTFSSGEGKFSLKAGTNGASYEGIYEVTYTNTCPTSFKFKITDRSLNVDGVAENWAVCEGEPLTITVVNFDNTPFHFDPRKYTIEWEKDDTPLPYKTEVLHIASTTPNDNGKYSFKITSSGCVYLRNIAAGLPFKSKPKVKIDSTRLEHNGVYEVVRTKSKEITLPFIQPDMSLYEEKIIWRENGKGVKADGKEVVGSKVNSNNEVIGQTLKFGEIKTDHDYQIIIAYGDRGYDNEICGTSLDLSVKVDALLSIKTKLIDSEGNETEDMCINEEGVGFLIDTTGTGSILHENDFSFKIYEDTGDGRKTEIKKEEKDGLLFAEITPNKSANYQIVYKYNVGNQDSTKTYSITVHPAYEVEWDKNVRVCDGSQSFIPITKAEPHNDIKLTWLPDETLGNGSISGASVTGIFSGDGLYTKKQLTLVASTIGGYCAPKEYHPEFIIDKRIEGEFIAPEFVCEGYSATLNASKFQADEYIWSSEEFGEGVTHSGVSIEVTPKTMYPSYSVAMKRGACTETADIDLTVKYAPEFDRIDSLTYRTIEVVIVPSTGTAPFQYIVDNEIDEYVMNAVKDGLEYGTHNIKVIDNAGCQLDTVITINPPALEFPIHVSPNGDGKNDKFSIPTLKDAYPDAKIKIFDRWGKKLAEYRAGDSDLDWDGTYKGSDMPSTDYWYEIEIKEIKKTYVGHFTLIRQ